MAVESPVRSWSYELQNAFLKNSESFRTPYTFGNITPFNYIGREERVLKKSMFDIEPRNFADIISCSMYCPSGGVFIKQILGGLIFSYLKKIAKFSKLPTLLQAFQT